MNGKNRSALTDGVTLNMSFDQRVIDEEAVDGWVSFLSVLLQYLTTQEQQREKLMRYLEEIESQSARIEEEKNNIQQKLNLLEKERKEKEDELNEIKNAISNKTSELNGANKFPRFFEDFCRKIYKKFGISIALETVEETLNDHAASDKFIYVIFQEAVRADNTEDAIVAARRIHDEDVKEKCVASVLEGPRK
mgnify:CR=1 FL=1